MCSGLCGWRVRRRQTWAGSSSPSKAGQRREAQVVSGRSRSPSRLGSSGRGEGQEGDSGAAERRSRVDPAEADRQAPGHRVHVQRSRDRAGQHGGLVQGTQAGGHPQLPLAGPCGTRGQAGTYREELRCTCCRSWAAGRVTPWSSGTRTWPPSTWRRGPSDSTLGRLMAQIRHSRRSRIPRWARVVRKSLTWNGILVGPE